MLSPAKHPHPKWLADAIFYEIYPQSFVDSNGDGIGDIPGITLKLDYIKDLGCNAIWLNPCFDSPFKDAGYDVPKEEALLDVALEARKTQPRLMLVLVPRHAERREEVLAEIRQRGAALGADEVHVHLLATSAQESQAVEFDLRTAQFAQFAH